MRHERLTKDERINQMACELEQMREHLTARDAEIAQLKEEVKYHEREAAEHGARYEGRSYIRSMYGAWFRKDFMLKRQLLYVNGETDDLREQLGRAVLNDNMAQRKPYTAPTVRTAEPWEQLSKKQMDALCALRGIVSKP